MPNFDGTGPRGLGPMTGGGGGFCVMPLGSVQSAVYGRRFFKRGGRGCRNLYYATGLTGWQRASLGRFAFGGVLSTEEETQMLKEEASVLEKELSLIKERITIIEKQHKEE